MQELEGRPLWTAISYLASTAQHWKLTRTEIRKDPIRRAIIDNKSLQQSYAAAELIERVAQSLEMNVPIIAAQRVKRTIDIIRPRAQYLTPEDLNGIITPLEQLLQSFGDDLEARKIFTFELKYKEFYEPTKPLFSINVETKFPCMIEDVSEAAKCIALDRSTAAVFHLMRVMELANRELGTYFGVKFAQEKNWQNILNEINKAIKALDPNDSKTKQIIEVVAHLYHVKIAWRNETMHPKQTYTLDEAVAIFGATRTFVNYLALLV